MELGYQGKVSLDIRTGYVFAVLIVQSRWKAGRMANKDLKSNLKNMNKVPSKATVGKLAELLERQQIDVSQIGDIKKVSIYQSITKDAEGEPHVHDLMGIQISPQWETGPEWLSLIHI